MPKIIRYLLMGVLLIILVPLAYIFPDPLLLAAAGIVLAIFLNSFRRR